MGPLIATIADMLSNQTSMLVEWVITTITPIAMAITMDMTTIILVLSTIVTINSSQMVTITTTNPGLTTKSPIITTITTAMGIKREIGILTTTVEAITGITQIITGTISSHTIILVAMPMPSTTMKRTTTIKAIMTTKMTTTIMTVKIHITMK